MVSLYDAVKLTGRLDDDKDTVYLKKHRNDDTLFSKDMPDEILTVKRLKETYDLRHTEVVCIEAYFCCGDYQGQLLVIKEGINGKNRMGQRKRAGYGTIPDKAELEDSYRGDAGYNHVPD